MHLIEAELMRQNLTEEEAAREARLPADVFRGVRKGQRTPASTGPTSSAGLSASP